MTTTKTQATARWECRRESGTVHLGGPCRCAPAVIVVPVTFREACAFVAARHRHNNPPRGHKFSIGAAKEGGEYNPVELVGVAMVGRPIARAFDDGLTAEVIRTCTDGTRNVNSLLYGACRAASFAMGYRRVITYTQADESGASLRAAGFVRVGDRRPRKGWAASTTDERLKAMRDSVGNGGVARVLWEVRR